MKKMSGGITTFVVMSLFVFLFSCAEPTNPEIDNGSEPTKILSLKSFYQTQGYVRDISIGDNYIYIAEDQAGISIYDHQNDTLVVKLYQNSWENIRLIEAVESNNTLLAYNKYGSSTGILAFNIENINSPQVLPPIIGQTSGIEALEVYPNIEEGIDVYWVHDDGNNKLQQGIYNNFWLNGEPKSYNFELLDLEVGTEEIYLASEQLGVFIVDKETKDIVSSIDTPGETRALKIYDNTLYAGCQESGICVIDVTDPENPVQTFTEDTSGYAQSVDCNDDYLIVGSGGGGIYLYSLENPNEPQLLENYDENDFGYVYKVEIHNNMIFVGTKKGVYIFELNENK